MTPPNDTTGSAIIWPLDGPRAPVIDAIISALAFLRSSLPYAADLPAGFDIVAAESPDGHTVITEVRALVATLLADLTAHDAQTSLFGDRQDSALGELVATVGEAPTHATRAYWKAARADAASIIREIGLEHYGLACQFATDPKGAQIIVSTPLSAPTARVQLLGRLFERAEAFVLRDAFLTHERMASAWYFAQWSVMGRRKGVDPTDFARNVREQEWSLLDRETLTFGDTVIEALARDERWREIPPHQERLALALRASIADIFVVETVQDGRLTMRPVRGGRAHLVHEHNPDARVQPGYFLAGRLIPFAEHLHLWLRSPGAVMFPPTRPDQAAVFAEALTFGSASLPLSIAIEAILSKVVFGGQPPGSVRPAASAHDARELFDFATEQLDAMKRRKKVARDALPNELALRLTHAEAQGEYYQFSVDEPFAEWIDALSAQIHGGRSSGSASGPRSRNSEGGGGKHRKKKRRS